MKVLLVDDSEQSLFLLKKYIADEYEVIVATNGLDGIKQLHDHPDIRAIIADYNMPGMDGLTMVMKMKSIPNFKSEIVLMMTTETSDELVNKAINLGIAGWMLKPPDKESLLAALLEVTSYG